MSTEISEEEKAYRRGFDQALAFLLMDQGATNKDIQDLTYKRRIGNWRHGRKGFDLRKREEAPRMTISEAREVRSVLFTSYCADLLTQKDA